MTVLWNLPIYLNGHIDYSALFMQIVIHMIQETEMK